MSDIFGRSDVSLCVCLMCKLCVVSSCLCISCTVILVLRIARRGRLVECLLGERLACAALASCGRFTTCRGCQLGVDSRRCRVGGLLPIGFPFPCCCVCPIFVRSSTITMLIDKGLLEYRHKKFQLVLERPQCDNASTVSGIEFQSGLGGNRKFGRRWMKVVW